MVVVFGWWQADHFTTLPPSLHPHFKLTTSKKCLGAIVKSNVATWFVLVPSSSFPFEPVPRRQSEEEYKIAFESQSFNACDRSISQAAAIAWAAQNQSFSRDGSNTFRVSTLILPKVSGWSLSFGCSLPCLKFDGENLITFSWTNLAFFPFSPSPSHGNESGSFNRIKLMIESRLHISRTACVSGLSGARGNIKNDFALSLLFLAFECLHAEGEYESIKHWFCSFPFPAAAAAVHHHHTPSSWPSMNICTARVIELPDFGWRTALNDEHQTSLETRRKIQFNSIKFQQKSVYRAHSISLVPQKKQEPGPSLGGFWLCAQFSQWYDKRWSHDEPC